MVDFGFGLVPSSRMNLDLFDKEKYDELVAMEPDARICMACGSCTAVCTAGQFTSTSLRDALDEIVNAKADKALESLKACQLCGKCSMVCPRGINTRHLIMSINKVYSAK